MFLSQPWSNAEHGFIYSEDGTLYGFGNNSAGQLGCGHQKGVSELKHILTDPDIIKIYVGSSWTIMLKRDGVY